MSEDPKSSHNCASVTEDTEYCIFIATLGTALSEKALHAPEAPRIIKWGPVVIVVAAGQHGS